MITEQHKANLVSQSSLKPVSKVEEWIGIILCILVLASGIVERLVHVPLSYDAKFSPVFLPFIAAIIAATGFIRLNDHSRWLGMQQILRWTGLFLMIWTANGLPLDLLRLTPLMPPGIDWPGFITKALAFATAVVLARLVMKRPDNLMTTNIATWYGYAAFVLALPYPIMRTLWALGGTIGLIKPGAAGEGFLPWLASIPWILAAILSLLLITTSRWKPRRLLLTAGWFATGIVAMIGPAAFWFIISSLVTGTDSDGSGIGIKFWVPCLFYSSWFFWSIAAAAATRSYQLRSAGS
ncbi:MAG TPA: hypothetical protein VHI78_01150 [Bacteroidales bacterium]|jgi:hypothetical protein|nr:hypothetical protein [Bacteroidales bacterium]